MKLHKLRIHPAAGLAILLFLYVLTGLLSSFYYAWWMAHLTHPAFRIAGPIVFGCALGGAVFGYKRLLKVTLNIPAFFVILAGSAAVYFLMWGEFPLRGEMEAFTFQEWTAPDLVMRVVAWLEAIVIAFPPLLISIRRAGVFLRRYNRWAEVRFLEYGFVPFTDKELDRLSGGDSSVIARKPIDLTDLSRIHAVALCYIDKRRTEYIAVFSASWSKRGNIDKDSLLLLTMLDPEQIDELLADLYERNR